MRTDFENEMLIVGNKSLSNKHESTPHQSAEEHPTAVSNTSQHNLSANQKQENVLIADDVNQGQTVDYNSVLSDFNVDREDASDITAESSKLFGSSSPKKIALPEYKNFEELNFPNDQNINLYSDENSETGAKMGFLPDINAVKDILNEIPTSPKDEILKLISEKLAADMHPTNRKSFIDGLYNALSALWSGSSVSEATEQIKSRRLDNNSSNSLSFGDYGAEESEIEPEDFEKIRFILKKGSQDPESKRQVEEVLERGNLAELNEIFSNVKPVQELAHFLLDLIIESTSRSIGQEILDDSTITENTFNLPPMIFNAIRSQIISETFPVNEIVSMPLSTADKTYLISRNIETNIAANKINQLIDQHRLNDLFELENGEGDAFELKILDRLKEEMRTQFKGALLSDEKNLSTLLEVVHALKPNTRAVSHQLTSLSIPQDGQYNNLHHENHIPESSQIDASSDLKLIAAKLVKTYDNIAGTQDVTVDLLLDSAFSNIPVHSLPSIVTNFDESTSKTAETYSPVDLVLGDRMKQNLKNEITEVFEDFLEITKLIQSSTEGQTKIPPISDNITSPDFINVLVEMALERDQVENIFGSAKNDVTKNLICKSCSQLSQCKNLASECEVIMERNLLRNQNLDKISKFSDSNDIEIENQVKIIEEMNILMGPISNYIDDLDREQILKYYTLATQNFAHNQDGFDLDQPVIDSQLTPSGLSDETSTSTSSYQKENVDAQDVRNSIEKLTVQLKEKTKNHSNLQIFQIRSNELLENVSRDLKLSTGNLIPTSDLIEQIKTAINGKEEQKLKNVENMIKIGHFSNAFRIQARVQILTV